MIPGDPTSKPPATTNPLNRESAPLPRQKAVRKRLLTKAILLTIGAAVFVLLVLALRDARRRADLVQRMSEYAELLQRRVDESVTLPDDLAPPDVGGDTGRTYPVEEQVVPADVAKLHTAQTPLLVAYSAPLSMWLGESGRAVVLFHEGRFRARWMSNSRFEEITARQLESTSQSD